MIPALLLPLLFSATPVQPVDVALDDPPIRLWISNDRRFYPGDRAKVQVRTDYDGYLLVLHVDPLGHLRVLFPLDPGDDNFVRGDKKYEIRGRGGRESFDVDGTSGQGTVYAAVSHDAFRFDGFVLADHWDYRALAPSKLSNDPESELNDLVHRMAQSSFDYDLLTYDVFGRSNYASDYSSNYYGSAYYGDPWCRFSCAPYFGYSPFNLSIGLAFGRPYRRYYYDPYFYAYDPFYNPFFYDPYYYAPVYYPRYVYPRRFYGYYNDPYYYGRYRGYDRPYTPYRLRGAEGFSAGYRGRIRSINTVYYPPVSPVREPATVTPGRRVAGGSELPEGLTPRRSVGHEQRMDTKPIEARRARPVERTGPARDADGPRRSGVTDPQGRGSGSSEAGPRREVDAPRNREAPEARPSRREVERSAPAQDRGGRQVQGDNGGGGRSEGGARPSNGGGGRRR